MKNTLIQKFKDHFGFEPAHIAYAPGRVEVLGNHTDYNEGYVLSAAINYGTYFAIAPIEGDTCRLVAGDLMHEIDFPLESPHPVTEDTWANYCLGVHAELLARGLLKCAYAGMFLGNIPQGSGLSSSAALETTTAYALAAHSGITLDKLEAAKIGQASEHKFAGVKCGLLDQISSIYGKENMLVKTDFRTLKVENVPLSKDVVLLICNSNAKHALVDGAYNERREACESAAKYFQEKLGEQVKTLRDVTSDDLAKLGNGLPDRVRRLAAHPIGEDERVLAATAALERNDLSTFGQLMFTSHDSSRFLFENSCEELDILVDIAKKTKGILGARLSGGGFGGSIVALAMRDSAEAAAKTISEEYTAKTGKPCDAKTITCSQGARLV